VAGVQKQKRVEGRERETALPEAAVGETGVEAAGGGGAVLAGTALGAEAEAAETGGRLHGCSISINNLFCFWVLHLAFLLLCFVLLIPPPSPPTCFFVLSSF